MPSARWGKNLTILTWTMSSPSPGISAGDFLSPYHFLFSSTLDVITRTTPTSLTAPDYKARNPRVTEGVPVRSSLDPDPLLQCSIELKCSNGGHEVALFFYV